MRNKTRSATDFMRIRQYIYDVIATNGSTPVQFPSTRKLAEQFSVSQPTALRVVRDLIAEGTLESCKGGGTISRPSTFGRTEKINIFGLVPHLGCQSFDVHYYVQITSAVCLELTRRKESYCTQQLYLESPSLLAGSVQEANLSGLILLNPDPHIIEFSRKLKLDGLPTVAFMKPYNDISSVYLPLDKCFDAILKKLFAEDRKHILVISWPQEEISNPISQGIKQACEEANVPQGQVIHLHDSVDNIYPKVEEMLNFGMKFDGVIFYPFYRSIYELIKSKRDLQNDCRMVIDNLSVFDDLSYTGYVIEQDLKKAAKTLVDDLLLQVEKTNSEPISKEIKFNINSYLNGDIQCN